MQGNVWEWVEDCSDWNYTGAPTDGSAWTGGSCIYRILRGGSWLDVPGHLRAANRFSCRTGIRTSNIGFRVARTLRDSGSHLPPLYYFTSCGVWGRISRPWRTARPTRLGGSDPLISVAVATKLEHETPAGGDIYIY